MKAKTAIAVPLILIKGRYLGLKAYVYFSAKSDVDNLVKQASLFADVRYGGISSDLMEGSISINDIVISPRTLQDEIKIVELKMQGDGPAFLFTDTSKWAQQTPEFMKLSLFSPEPSMIPWFALPISTVPAFSTTSSPEPREIAGPS